MIGNERYEVEWAKAARKIARRAREMAEGECITLTGAKWHRGHEVADLDDWWLTLTSDKRGVTERFPNEWLEALGTPDTDWRVAQCLSRMVQALAAPPKPQMTRALNR